MPQMQAGTQIGGERMTEKTKHFSYTKKNWIVHPVGQLNILFVKFVWYWFSDILSHWMTIKLGLEMKFEEKRDSWYWERDRAFICV